jgi:hypothetical protein
MVYHYTSIAAPPFKKKGDTGLSYLSPIFPEAYVSSELRNEGDDR